jgi:hypothetical protein
MGRTAMTNNDNPRAVCPPEDDAYNTINVDLRKACLEKV